MNEFSYNLVSWEENEVVMVMLYVVLVCNLNFFVVHKCFSGRLLEGNNIINP